MGETVATSQIGRSPSGFGTGSTTLSTAGNACLFSLWKCSLNCFWNCWKSLLDFRTKLLGSGQNPEVALAQGYILLSRLYRKASQGALEEAVLNTIGRVLF
jgi:hypothetical protein